jgi:hypothetical protein
MFTHFSWETSLAFGEQIIRGLICWSCTHFLHLIFRFCRNRDPPKSARDFRGWPEQIGTARANLRALTCSAISEGCPELSHPGTLTIIGGLIVALGESEVSLRPH